MTGRLSVMLAALWWGSLTAVGFLVVPLLFAYLDTPAMAGRMAARLFTAQTWVSVGCGALLLMLSRSRWMPERNALQPGMGLVVGALLLALLSEFAVAPHIVARENLALWHSVGSGMYLVQWVCAGVLLWKLAAPQPDPPPG